MHGIPINRPPETDNVQDLIYLHANKRITEEEFWKAYGKILRRIGK